MKKFWNWTNQTDNPKENGRTLFLNGTIADESWYDDDVTPQLFKNDLYAESGDVTVWLNSPGGDCVAAAQIYNMLKEYDRKLPIRLIITDTPINMVVTIDDFSYTIGRDGDMKYSITLSEVKLI